MREKRQIKYTGLLIAAVIVALLILAPGQRVYAAAKYRMIFDHAAFTYTGSKIVPKVTIKDSKGKKVSKKNYDITYMNSAGKVIKKPTAPDVYTITAIMKGKYKGSVTRTFKIKATTYFVHFYKNGGEGTMETQKCKTGLSYNLSQNLYTREDYSFIGWNTQKDGSGTSYGDMAEIKDLSLESKAKIKLYAQWELTASNRKIGDFSESYKASVYYERLQGVKYVDSIEEMIAQVALSQVGYHEADKAGDFAGTTIGSNNYTEYGRWCGLKDGYGAWCGSFVSWCLYMADVPNAKICTVGNYAKDCFGGKFTPLDENMTAADFRKGDILPVDWNGGKDSHHVEIVYNDPVTEGVVKTVSGNSGDAVVMRTYDLLTMKKCKIFGYIRMSE